MNLRRVLTAFAVLALFVGLASAQVVLPTPINCSVTAQVPTLRSQGVVERPGDVIITCTGGPTPQVGNPSSPSSGATDRATIAISFAGVPITNATAKDSVSINGVGQYSTDALLLIDEPNEPGGPVAGYGQNAGITVCTAAQQAADVVLETAGSPPTNCPAYAQQAPGGYWVIDPSNPAAGHEAANAYQGSTPSSSGGNTVLTFQSVPVLATGSSAVERVYRLVNTRLNVGSNASITASVTVTPNTNAITTLNLTNNAVSAGTAASGLSTSVVTIGGATLCSSTDLNPVGGKTKANAAILTFTPGFANAFKSQALAVGAATVPTVVANSIATPPVAPAQNHANGNYSASYTPAGAAPGTTPTSITVTSTSSESGVIVPTVAGATALTPGLAKSGTRFVAKFTGLNANATYYVSAENVIDYANEAVPPGAIGDANPTPYAIWAGSSAPETAAFGFAIPVGTSLANPVAPAAGVKVVKLSPDPSALTAEAYWEVTNTQSSAPFMFAFYAVYSNVSSPPPTGTDGSVALGFAPTTGSGGSQTNSWIPRFSPIGSAVPAFVVVPCQTTLLFPFVTTTKVTATQHWDTGIAIANTGADPWNSVVIPTTPSTTTYCTLSFYGSGVSSGLNQASQFSPPSVQTPPIGPGQTYAFDASDPLSLGTAPNVGFAGYMFAVCNFQFAHGFAYIEDGAADTSGVGNSMGYLALVVDNTGPLQRAAALTGENLSH